MARHIQDLVRRGQRVLINGKKGSYVIDSAIKSSVFKAHIQNTLTPVMVKTESHPVTYEREFNAYEFDCIRNSPCIRSIYEPVDNGEDKCMVFEWMEHDLWSLRGRQWAPDSVLPKIVARSTLKALVAFLDMDGQGQAVHTDVNPNNILVSNPESSSPSVKLADLENLVPSGDDHEYRPQGFAIRAPEIWMGRPVSPACDVWSVGVTLAHFMAGRPLFGPSGLNIQVATISPEMTQAAWSLGKMTQLLGPLSWDKDSKYTKEYNLADMLVRKGHIPSGSLEEALIDAKVSRACIGFIRYLLTLDPHERPTAAQALGHPWLQDMS